jgi:signal transduction histidine kinase
MNCSPGLQEELEALRQRVHFLEQEQKRHIDLEAALQESENRFKSLFLGMTEGVSLHEMVYDTNGKPINYRITNFNVQYEKILNIKRADFQGKLGTEAYGTATPPYLAEFGQVAETGIPFTFETFFPPLGKHFFISVAPFGKGRFATIFFDVTAQKSLEKALKEKILALTTPLALSTTWAMEDLFDMDEIQIIQDAFAAATGVASVITTPDGKPLTRPSNFSRLCSEIIRQSPKGCANCYASDAALGRVHPDGPVMQPCLSGGLWDGGTSIQVGDCHVANWLIGQILDEDVEEEKMVAYAREIEVDPEVFRTALREVTRMPKERFADICQALFLIARQLSRLAYQNIQQAQHLHEQDIVKERIKQLNEDLIIKNHEMENIVYVASHDLRSPLVNIIGFSEKLGKLQQTLIHDLDFELIPEAKREGLRTLLQDKVPRALHFIQAGAGKIDSLINGLLSFSRVGRIPLSFVTLNMNEVLNSVVQALTFQIQECQAQISIDTLPPCRGDTTQLNQAFTNLIDNALKYRDPHKPLLVDITGHPEGDFIEYQVSDTGPGIQVEHQPKIWELFHRLDPQHTPPGEGLGLTLVKKIIERHGGKIWVFSTPGQGTTFFIRLPRPLTENTTTSEEPHEPHG